MKYRIEILPPPLIERSVLDTDACQDILIVFVVKVLWPISGAPILNAVGEVFDGEGLNASLSGEPITAPYAPQPQGAVAALASTD